MKAYTYYLGLILVSQSCIAIKFYQSEAEEITGMSSSTEMKTMLPMGKTVMLEGEPHPLYFFVKDETLKLDVFGGGSKDSLKAKTIRTKIKQETDSTQFGKLPHHPPERKEKELPLAAKNNRD